MRVPLDCVTQRSATALVADAVMTSPALKSHAVAFEAVFWQLLGETISSLLIRGTLDDDEFAVVAAFPKPVEPCEWTPCAVCHSLVRGEETRTLVVFAGDGLQ